MIDLLTSPEAWAALLTLTALEIVLGIDNVIFLSVIVSRIPERQAKRARQIGLALALVFRIVLLSVLVWLIGLTQPVFTIQDIGFSWRDIILIGGGAFLIAKATHEIHGEVEAQEEGDASAKPKSSAFFWIIGLTRPLFDVLTARRILRRAGAAGATPGARLCPRARLAGRILR